MYRRRQRTPRSAASTPSRMSSTPKYQVGNENDHGLNNLATQLSQTASQKRKEVDQIASEHLKRHKTAASGSYFEQVVTGAGYIFQQGDNPHLLCTY